METNKILSVNFKTMAPEIKREEEGEAAYTIIIIVYL